MSLHKNISDVLLICLVVAKLIYYWSALQANMSTRLAYGIISILTFLLLKVIRIKQNASRDCLWSLQLIAEPPSMNDKYRSQSNKSAPNVLCTMYEISK